jgi:glutamate N-acetyltransferase / amino-acid N-acetyltransferase
MAPKNSRPSTQSPKVKLPKTIPGGMPLWQVEGFSCGSAYAGLQKAARGQRDVGVLFAPQGANVGGVFTRNQAAAAPVILSREVVASGRIGAIVVNAGNANACTGQVGMRDARSMTEITGRALGLPADQVLVASTGVIGQPLPMDKIEAGIWDSALEATSTGKGRLSRAILTTDLREKRSACRVKIGGRMVTIAGITKGSGMIAPNMATTLSFLVTDADCSPAVLRKALKQACGSSLNCLTVDGQCSTNDCMFLLSSGCSSAGIKRTSGSDYQKFAAAVQAVSIDLARQIARDGEGATKLLEVRISGARNDTQAAIAARAVSDSLLVKTAMFGCDPNWGRILSAIGQTTAEMKLDQARVKVAGLKLYDSRPLKIDPRMAKKKLGMKEVTIDVDLRLGSGSALFFACDLSYDYVKINAEYHT